MSSFFSIETNLTLYSHRLIRESIPDAVLGLFVHTPFPSSEVFRCLPRKLPSFTPIMHASSVVRVPALCRFFRLDGSRSCRGSRSSVISDQTKAVVDHLQLLEQFILVFGYRLTARSLKSRTSVASKPVFETSCGFSGPNIYGRCMTSL